MESIHEQVAHGRTCKHGTPVGTPGGADLMCGWCEDGTSDQEFAAILAHEARLATLRARQLKLVTLLGDAAPTDTARIERIAALIGKNRRQLTRSLG